MMNIIYAALSISAQAKKTTFSCKDDCTLTKHTGRWKYSAKNFEIPLCHIPPLRSFLILCWIFYRYYSNMRGWVTEANTFFKFKFNPKPYLTNTFSYLVLQTIICSVFTLKVVDIILYHYCTLSNISNGNPKIK